jgi:hypothetical protein
MSESQPSRQNLLWVGVVVAVLVGVGVMAFLAGSLFSPPAVAPTAPPTQTPLPPPVVTIQGIKAQAELATVEYTAVTEIYKEHVPEGWFDDLIGTRERMLLLVYGEVRAGFDLSEIEADDLQVEGTRVRLVLPPPKILNSSIDFEQTHVVYYQNSLIFDQRDPNLQGEALQEAQVALEEAALTAGIINQAGDYGQVYYENFLYSLGFTEVEVVIDTKIYQE